jgi:hypothetical protein
MKKKFYQAGFGEIRFGIPDNIDSLALGGDNHHVCRVENWEQSDGKLMVNLLVEILNNPLNSPKP